MFIFWIGYLKYKLQVGIRPDYCPWYYIKAYGLYLLSRMFVGVLFEQIRGHQKCAWRGHVRSMSARCVHVLETVVGQGVILNVESCSCQGLGYLFLRLVRLLFLVTFGNLTKIMDYVVAVVRC